MYKLYNTANDFAINLSQTLKNACGYSVKMSQKIN